MPQLEFDTSSEEQLERRFNSDDGLRQEVIERLAQFSFRCLRSVQYELENLAFSRNPHQLSPSALMLREAIDLRKCHLSGFSTIENFSESNFPRMFYWLSQQSNQVAQDQDPVSNTALLEVLDSLQKYYRDKYFSLTSEPLFSDPELTVAPNTEFILANGAIPTLASLEASFSKILRTRRFQKAPQSPSFDLEGFLRARIPSLDTVTDPLLIELHHARQFTFAAPSDLPNLEFFIQDQIRRDQQIAEAASLAKQRGQLKQFLLRMGNGDSVTVNGIPMKDFRKLKENESEDEVLDRVLLTLAAIPSNGLIKDAPAVASAIEVNQKLVDKLLASADLIMSSVQGVNAYLALCSESGTTKNALLLSQVSSGSGAIDNPVEYNYFQLPNGDIGVESKACLFPILPQGSNPDHQPLLTVNCRFTIRDTGDEAVIEMMPPDLRMQPPLHRQASLSASSSPVFVSSPRSPNSALTMSVGSTSPTLTPSPMSTASQASSASSTLFRPACQIIGFNLADKFEEVNLERDDLDTDKEDSSESSSYESGSSDSDSGSDDESDMETDDEAADSRPPSRNSL